MKIQIYFLLVVVGAITASALWQDEKEGASELDDSLDKRALDHRMGTSGRFQYGTPPGPLGNEGAHSGPPGPLGNQGVHSGSSGPLGNEGAHSGPPGPLGNKGAHSGPPGPLGNKGAPSGPPGSQGSQRFGNSGPPGPYGNQRYTNPGPQGSQRYTNPEPQGNQRFVGSRPPGPPYGYQRPPSPYPTYHSSGAIGFGGTPNGQGQGPPRFQHGGPK